MITKGLDDAIQAFQRKAGFRVDGNINPGGEKVRALATAVSRADDGDDRPEIPDTSDGEQPGTGNAERRPKITIPKGGIIRNDSHGLGHFGAPRGGGTRKHEGVDITVTPGQPVPSPIDGEVIRTGNAYGTDNKGLRSTHIRGTGNYAGITVKILYVDNVNLKKGSIVKAGVPMGKAQDVRIKHGNRMLPHAHY